MSKIIFNKNPKTIYDCHFSQIGEHQIKLIFKTKIPKSSIYLSGCKIINEWNHALIQTDRSNYTYLYRTYEEAPNTIELCDNNIPYEQADMDITMKEHPLTLDEIKKRKIAQMSLTCNEEITRGVSIHINDTLEHFSYRDEDQTNIKEIFDLAIQTNIPMYYHSNNQGCKLYNVEQILLLYTTAAMNKLHHTTYFNQMKMYIESLHDPEIINSISYGDQLPDQYSSTYSHAMTQARESMETLLENRKIHLTIGER
ncbi:MAG: hypothetical protein HFI78_12470 [Lachnospiraceae bacterium]|jgi:hypothetical protein|nr:hypothetical protein [Lachnospiraceae bacterium]